MIEEALVSRLTGDPRLAAKIGPRVYPVKLPQDVVYPALSYFRAATHTEHTHQGGAGLAGPLFQISVWAKTFTETRDIAELVRLALDGFQGTAAGVVIDGIFLRNANDIYEDDLEVFHRPMDFEVWHEETRPSF